MHGPQGPMVTPLNVDATQLIPHYYILQLARSVKWFATIDICLCILLFFGEPATPWRWVKLVAVISPIMGVKGARELKKHFVLVYLIFSVVKSFYWVADFFVTPLTTIKLLLSVGILIIQVYITRIVYRLWHSIRMLTEAELLDLRESGFQVSGFVYW